MADMTSPDNHQPRLFPLDPDPDRLRYLYAVLMPSHAIKLGWTGRAPVVQARELNGVVLAFTFGTLSDEAALHDRVVRWRSHAPKISGPRPMYGIWSTD